MQNKLRVRITTVLATISLALSSFSPLNFAFDMKAMAAENVGQIILNAGGGQLTTGCFRASNGSVYATLTYPDSNNDGSITIDYPLGTEASTFTPTKTHYTFAGWYDSYKGGKKIFGKEAHTFTTPTHDTIYYARYLGETYNITFAPAGDEFTPITRVFRLGSDNNISPSALGLTVADDKVIAGWEYDDGNNVYTFDASDNVYNDFTSADRVSPIFQTPNVTLTAIVVPKNVYVTYDANGGTLEDGAATSATFEYNQESTLPNATKTNYDLIGWQVANYDGADGRSLFVLSPGQSSASCFNITDASTSSSRITLKAIWQEHDSVAAFNEVDVYIVTPAHIVDGIGISLAPTNIKSAYIAQRGKSTPTTIYNNTTGMLPSQLPSLKGHVVSGWRLTDADGELDGPILGANLRASLANNGTLSLISYAPNSEDNEIVTTLKPNTKLKNYTFEVPDGLAKVPIYIKPIWLPIQATFGYDLNGGTGTTSDKLTIKMGQQALLAPRSSFSKDGYSFMGWGGNNISSSNKTTNSTPYLFANSLLNTIIINDSSKLLAYDFSQYLDMSKWTDLGLESLPARNIIFSANADNTLSNLTVDLSSITSCKIKAIWDTNVYTVKFDPNFGSKGTGTGTMDDQAISSNVATELSHCLYALEGYTFAGWSTSATGNVEFEDQEEVTNLASAHATITLYAQWTALPTPSIPLVVGQKWDDGKNQDGLRPDTLTYTISAKAGSKTLTADDLGLATLDYTIDTSESEVHLCDVPYQYVAPNGAVSSINYYVNTKIPASYTSEVRSSSSSGQIKVAYTYKYTPKTVLFTVTLNWTDNDNQDGQRPSSVNIVLKGSDGSSITKTVSVSSSDKNTTFKFESLPEYAGGEKIVYTATIEEVSGYSVKSTVSKNTCTIIASHTTETTSATVNIVWDDNNNELQLRPNSVSVALQGSGASSSKANITLNAANGWSATRSDLPKYAKGSAIQYSASLQSVKNYTSEISTSGQLFTVTLHISADAKAQNDKNNKDKTSAEEAAKKAAEEEAKKKAAQEQVKQTVTKEKIATRDIVVRTIWNDNASDLHRPSSIEISLVGSNHTSYDKTLSAMSGFSTTFTEIPVDDEASRQPITYKIKYVPISGYTTHVYHNLSNENEFIIENFRPAADNLLLVDEADSQTVNAGHEINTFDHSLNKSISDVQGENMQKDLIEIGAVKTQDESNVIIQEPGTVSDPTTLDPPSNQSPQQSFLQSPTAKYLILGGLVILLGVLFALLFIIIRKMRR